MSDVHIVIEKIDFFFLNFDSVLDFFLIESGHKKKKKENHQQFTLLC